MDSRLELMPGGILAILLDERGIEADFGSEGPTPIQARRRVVMSGSQTFQRLTQETIEEHHQIHFYLDQVAQTLKSLRQGIADVEPMRRLAAQLQGFKERLVEHHQTEEKGGLFHAILEVLPSRRVEVDRLRHQHAKMLEILEMARIHAQCGEVTEADGLRVDLEEFLEMFRQHERDEEDLLRLALERDGANQK
jgi:hypothetical protein